MRPAQLRSYLLPALLMLSGCLENLTVGREILPLTPRDSGANGGIDASATGGDPGGNTDSGLLRDAGGDPVDAGPCAPAACQDLPVHIQKAPGPECATGEAQICTRDASGVCALQCPPIPIAQRCNSPIQLTSSDGGICAAGEFCRFDLKACGGGIGACTAIPESCDEIDAPVCGCDGKTYPNLCSLSLEGLSATFDGPCP